MTTDKYLGDVRPDHPHPRSGITAVHAQSPAAKRHAEVRPTAFPDKEPAMPISPYIANMSQSEREAEIQRIAAWQPGSPSTGAPQQWRPEDVFQAAAEARLTRLGVLARPRHPLADHLLNQPGVELDDTTAIGYVASQLGFDLEAQKATTPMGIARMAVRASSQLSELFSTAAVIALDRVPNPLRAKVERLTYPLSTRDFKNVEIVDIQVPNVGLALPNDGWDAYLHVNLSGATQTFRLGTLDMNLRASIQAIVNGQGVDILRRGAASFRYAAYSNELRAICQGLDNGVTFDDGAAWFDTSNLVDTGSGAAPSAATLNAAAALLRAQASAAGTLDLDISTLLVPAALEATARTVVAEAGWNIEVIASAHLSGSFWYAFADQMVSPSIARLSFEGSSGESVAFGPSEPSKDGTSLQISASHKVALAPLSRIGLVKHAVA